MSKVTINKVHTKPLGKFFNNLSEGDWFNFADELYIKLDSYYGFRIKDNKLIFFNGYLVIPQDVEINHKDSL